MCLKLRIYEENIKREMKVKSGIGVSEFWGDILVLFNMVSKIVAILALKNSIRVISFFKCRAI